MKLQLKRTHMYENCTVGELTVDGKFSCYTLEDKERGLNQAMNLQEIIRKKIHGKTAIPTGKYEVNITFSNRFQKPMPEVTPVKGFLGIRIHTGNTSQNTEGCILVGKSVTEGYLSRSREAFNELMPLLRRAGDITIEIL